MKPMKLLLPGLFLLVLGTGNIAVGFYKQAQYEVVIKELSETMVIPEQIRTSPLMRIEISKPSPERYRRQQKAENRRNFYSLVALGGKLLLLVSVVLLLTAAVLQFREQYLQARQT